MCLPAQLLITIGVSLWLGLQYDPYTAFAGAGIPVFSFITPLPSPLSYAGPAVGVWVVIGLIYLGYLYARHPERVGETRRIFITDEPQPVAAGHDPSGGAADTGA